MSQNFHQNMKEVKLHIGPGYAWLGSTFLDNLWTILVLVLGGPIGLWGPNLSFWGVKGLILMIFKLAVTFFSGFERSTNFHILLHMPKRSYHININSGVGWSLFLILLSKSHIFSPKNLRFFSVKIFWVVLAKKQNYQIDPWASAVAPSYQTQTFWSDFWTGVL